MAKTIRVGILGTSWWADAMHLPALAAHPQAEIVAIGGRNLQTAQAMAQRWNIPQVYTDWEALLAQSNIEALVVSTANDTHYPISMAALERGIHVLCEKPLALTYPQALHMAAYAEKKGLKTLVPFTYGYMPTTRYLKELIDGGYIGRPYHLNLRYYTGYARQGDYMWRFDQSKAGAGVLGDIASHFLYLADLLYGEITGVFALLGHQVERPALDSDGQPYEVAEDSCLLTLQFANGAQGSLHATAVCYEDTPFGQTHHGEFHGSGGTLYTFTDWDTVQEVKGAQVGEGRLHELPIPDHIWNGARHDTVHNTYRDLFRTQDWMTRQFISALANDQQTELHPSFRDGARIQRYIEAGLRSAAEKRWVGVNEV
jgi:predicted dehydrogenase